MARDPVKVGHEFAHARAGVANRPPLARRIGYLFRLQERGVLGALEVRVGAVAGDLVHDLVEDPGLQPLGLEMALLERNPLVQAHEVRDDVYRAQLVHAWLSWSPVGSAMGITLARCRRQWVVLSTASKVPLRSAPSAPWVRSCPPAGDPNDAELIALPLYGFRPPWAAVGAK